MTTLGQQWQQRVPANAENLRVLQEGIVRREDRARIWVQQIQLKDLPDGIASCISRGSDSLALPLPTEIAATHALRMFIVSLENQTLIADIALDAEGDGQSLLLISPFQA